MTINPIATNAPALKPVTQTSPEAREVGPDHDGDADDAGGKISAPAHAVAPTVNLSGQVVGATVSTKA